MVLRTGYARFPWTNYKTSNHIITYLDMLGAKQMICKDNDFNFLNHLNMFMEDAIEESGGGIFPKKEEIFVKIFSDNILLAIELKENDEQRNDKIAILFNTVANIYNEILRYGYLMRGAIVEVMHPKPDMTILDPACGTGGFLLAAYDYMKKQTKDKEKLKELRENKIHGIDITPLVVSLCAMNLYLHGIGNGQSPVKQGDSLMSAGEVRYDMVLTNPPFGKKSATKILGDDGSVTTEKEDFSRDDFTATTSNKQINFLQHIMTVLKIEGHAAVVIPDNVLFEGGAGEKVRKKTFKRF